MKGNYSKYDYGKKQPGEEKLKVEDKKPLARGGKDESEKKEVVEEEEMPDLNDPEVVKSSLAIQKAYLKKKNKANQKANQEKDALRDKKQSHEQIKSKQEIPVQKSKKNEEAEEEEMPDLNDPGVQQSTLAIQKAYLKRKNKEQAKEERKKELEAMKQQYSKYDTKKEAEEIKAKEAQKKAEEEEEEMPDLNDPGVQQSTLAIQKAYLKKKNKAKAAEERKKNLTK